MDVLSCVTLELPKDMALLERFYKELMIPNFPMQEELEPIEAWIDQLTQNNSNRNKKEGVYLNVQVCFDSKDTERKVLVGGIVFEYYYPSNTALITYLVTNPNVRGQGSGVFLGLNAWGKMKQLSEAHGFDTPHIIFCEVNDPALVSDSEDSLSPLARIKAFQQMGVRVIDCPQFKYVQPALEGQTERGRSMLLAVVVGPMTPRDDDGRSYVNPNHIKGFLADFYRELEVKDVDKDEDFQLMMKALSGSDRVYLKDFDLSRFKASSKKKKAAEEEKKRQEEAHVKTEIPVHIIVVGAGLSGLACAQDLVKAGFRVTVLEGRNRVGGRVYTGRSFDTKLDIGAAWLHGLENNPLAEYAESAISSTLKMHKSNDQAIILYDNEGKPIDQNAIFEGYMKFQQLMESFKAELHAEAKCEGVEDGLKKPLEKRNVQAALQAFYARHPEFHYKSLQEKIIMNHFFSQQESLQAAKFSQLNARDYDEGIEYEGGDNIIYSGFQNIAIALSKGLNIKLDQIVKKVEYVEKQKDGKVQVNALPLVKLHTEKGDVFECNGVVITASIGVLHSNLISFSPALPKWKADSIQNIGSGLFNKCILRFDKQFWPNSADYMGFNFEPSKPLDKSDLDLKNVHLKRSNSWFVNYALVAKQPLIVCMMSGEFAEEMEKLSDKEVEKRVVGKLKKLFGNAVGTPTDCIVTRWGSDPLSLGSYSHLKQGGSLRDHDLCGQPVGKSVFFCGEHTSLNRFGYADGAYVSGQREAKRIIELYQHLKSTTIKSKL